MKSKVTFAIRLSTLPVGSRGMFPESRLEARKLLTSRDLTSTSLKQIVYENEPIVSAEQPKSKPAVRDQGNRCTIKHDLQEVKR